MVWSRRALSPEELRALRADRIGMVFQNMALLPHRTPRCRRSSFRRGRRCRECRGRTALRTDPGSVPDGAWLDFPDGLFAV